MISLSKRYTNSVKDTGAFANAEVLSLTCCKDKRLLRNTEAYTSLYAYESEELKKHIDTYKTIRGYIGTLHSKELLIDIDRDKIEDSHKETLSILHYLKSVYSIEFSNIQVWLSGRKGFHIILPEELFGSFTPSPKLNLEQKTLVSYLFDGIDYDIVIYNHTRLIRLPYSIHPDTKLYKKDIPIEMLLNSTIEDIKNYCKELNEDDILEDDEEFRYTISRPLEDLYKKAQEEIKNVNLQPQQTYTHNIIAPTKRKKCIYKLMAGANVGERHQYAMRIANYFYKEGLGDLTHGILTKWNEKLNDPLPEEEIQQIIEDAKRYDYGCRDRILSRYCDPSCYIYELIKNEKEILNIEKAHEEYTSYISDLEHNKIELNDWIPITEYTKGFIRGEVIVILARTGNGKTAFIQNLVMAKKIPTVIFSFELATPLLYQRLIQIGENQTSEWVEQVYKEDENSIDIEKYDHIYIVTKTLSLEEMSEIIQNIKDRYNTEVIQVVIDYLSLVKSKTSNPYQKISELARESKEFAKKNNVITYILSQTGREEGDGELPVTMSSGRDSGAIEEAADVLLGIWRPQKNNEDLEVEEIFISILKNRKGQAGVVLKTLFKRSTLRIGKLEYVNAEE